MSRMICNSFSVNLCFANGKIVTMESGVENEGPVVFSDRMIQEDDVESFKSIRAMIADKILIFGCNLLSGDNDKFDDGFEDDDDFEGDDDYEMEWEDYWDSVSEYDYSDLCGVILMTHDDEEHRMDYIIIHVKPSFKILSGSKEQSYVKDDSGRGDFVPDPKTCLRELIKDLPIAKTSSSKSKSTKSTTKSDSTKSKQGSSSSGKNSNADENFQDENFQYILRKKKYDFDLGKEVESPRYEITSYIGTPSSVEVPETIGGIKVEKFSLGERRDILKLTIPDSVEYDVGQLLKCEGLYDDSGNLIINGRLLKMKNITPILRIPDGVHTIAESVIYWYEGDEYHHSHHAYQKDDIIEELILPEGLKRIEGEAFKNCESLCTIQFPKSLEEIGYEAFSDCESLRTFQFPESLKVVKSGAFSGCKSLTEIVLPEGTKEIGIRAFAACKSLRVIRVPSTCHICEQAFEHCSEVGKGPTIVNGIFFDADPYDDVIIVPPEVESISAYAIGQPGDILDSVTITDNIKYISDSAFWCTGIQCFRVVDHLTGKLLFETKKFKSSYSSSTTLDSSPRFKKACDLICAGKFSALAEYGKVFTEDDHNKMDKPPKQNTAISMSEIKKNWKYHLNEEGKQKYATIWGYLGNDTVIDIPSQIGEYQVKVIGNEAFADCTSLVSVTISQSVVEIGKNAFSNCTSLKEIRIPDGVETIATSTFLNCSSLDSIAIPQSVRKIGHDAFANCTNLREIRIPEGIETIEDNTFLNCSSLDSIAIPQSVRKIGHDAFANCTNLREIDLPKEAKSIEENAFLNCLNLERVSISERVTSIGPKAFCGCKKLSNKEGFIIIRDVLFNYYGTNDSVSIPEGVDKIDEGVFSGNSNLLSIRIPDSVISIGREAFSNCSNLKNIAIPKGVKNIGSSAFCGCSHLKSVELSGSDICIEREAFCDCSELEKISLLNVSSIGPQAFQNCTSLKSITISMPNSKRSGIDMCCPFNSLYICSNGSNTIGDEAFSGCTNLETAVLAERVCAIGKKAFSNCTNLKSIILSDLILHIALDAFVGCLHLSEISVVPDYSKPTECWLKEYGEFIEKDPIIVFEQKNFVFQPEAGYVDCDYTDFRLAGTADSLFKEKTGGVVSNRVSGKTDYLVIESNNVDKKLQTAIELKNSGKPVKIVLYNDFLSSLFSKTILNISSESTSTKSTTKSSSSSSSSTSELKAPVQNEAKAKTTKSAPSKSKRGSSSSGKNSTETVHEGTTVTQQDCEIDSSGVLTGYFGSAKNIILPNGITAIGQDAFFNNENINSVVIPEGVDKIEDGAFWMCTNLKSVVLPSTIQKIGDNAFNSSGLTSIVIPDGCEEIGTDCFTNCEKLKDIYVSASVCEIGVDAFCTFNDAMVIHTSRGSTADSFAKEHGWTVDYKSAPSAKPQTSTEKSSTSKNTSASADELSGLADTMSDLSAQITEMQNQDLSEEDRKTLNEAMGTLGDLMDDLHEGQTAMGKYGDYLEQQEAREKAAEEEKARKKAEAMAAGKSEKDIVNMYVILTNEKKLGKLDRSQDEFCEIYEDDFAALSKAEIINTRKDILSKMEDEALCAYYTESFKQRSTKDRFTVSTLNLNNVSDEPDYGKKAEFAIENTKEWFKPEEYPEVRKLMDSKLADARKQIDDQLEPVEERWTKFSSAIEFLQLNIATKEPHGSDMEDSCSCFQLVMGSDLVSVKLSTKGIFKMVTNVMNFYPWYWGVTICDIWEAAFRNEIRDDREGAFDTNQIANQAMSQIRAKYPEAKDTSAPDSNFNRNSTLSSNEKDLLSEDQKRQAFEQQIRSLVALSKEPILPHFENGVEKNEIVGQIISRAKELIGDGVSLSSGLAQYDSIPALETLRLTLGQKFVSAEVIIDAITAKKSAEYDRLSALLEKKNTDIGIAQQEIAKLEEERSHLGFFHGKRKKEIAALLEQLKARIKQIEDDYEYAKKHI